MKNYVYGIFFVSITWFAIVIITGIYIPQKYFKFFSIFILLSHCWGASSWLSQLYGFWSVMAFIIITSIIYSVTNKIYLSNDYVDNHKKTDYI